MAAPAIKVVSPAAVELSPFANPDVNEKIFDTSIERLRIQSTLNKAGLYVDVTDQITTGSVTDSFSSAPQIVFDCIDRGYKALNSGIFDDTVEINLDGVQYRLVQVSLTDTEMLELTWEHKIVALLRQHKSFLAVQRGAVTRAQFIEMLLREILPDFGEILYVCPEISTVQPVAAPRSTGRSLVKKTLSASKKTTTKRTAFGLTSLQIRDRDGTQTTLSKSQLDNASIVLEVCYQDGASAKATLAAMEACLVEPANPYENSSSGDSTSRGILQVLAGTAQGLRINPMDVAQCVHAFLTKGFYGRGGAIALALQNPGWTAGQVAQQVQGSQFGARYDQAQQGAQQVISAYTSAGGFAATGASALPGALAATKMYDFTRGRAGQTEDSYTCALRLAAEVQWRFFVAGRNAVYMVTDDDLLGASPNYVIGPASQGIAKPTFDIEKGGRTVVIHRHRVPKPSEAQIAVRASRLLSSVGDVVTLDQYGPADDKWLIKQLDRDLFDKAGTFYLQAPQKPLPEPAASTSTSTVPLAPGQIGPTSGNPISRVYAAAQAMSARGLPYGYAGHTGNWQTAARAPNQDCSSSVSLVLYAAGLMPDVPGPQVSNFFLTWGQPGAGRQMTVWVLPGSGPNGHVFIQFYGYPAKRFDTVPGAGGGPSGPRLRYTPPGVGEEAGFIPRHWPGF